MHFATTSEAHFHSAKTEMIGPARAPCVGRTREGRGSGRSRHPARCSTPPRFPNYDFLSFQTARGANTTTRPNDQSNAGTRKYDSEWPKSACASGPPVSQRTVLTM